MMSDSMQCPICRSSQQRDTARFLDYPTKHPLFAPCRLVSCSHCKGAWVFNVPPLEKLRKYYGNGLFGINPEKTATTLERCQALARWRYVLEALNGNKSDWLKKTIAVCDIGAGYGCTYEVAKHQGVSVDFFAYESTDRADRIRDLGAHVLGDFFEDKSNRQFDLVWASHILEHFADPDILLKEMGAIMRPEGLGFIEVPCLDHEFKLDLAPHFLFFSVAGLRKTIERNGFEVLAIDSAGRLRVEARDLFEKRVQQNASLHTLPSRLKRIVRVLMKQAPMKKEASLADDLKNESIFREWGLEAYGGERCWIRAVFRPKQT